MTTDPIEGTLLAANDVVSADIRGYPSAVIQLAGTWAGTVTFEASVGGDVWAAAQMIVQSSGALATTATANGLFICANPGYWLVRARMSSFTSGVASVAILTGLGAEQPAAITAAGGLWTRSGTILSPTVATDSLKWGATPTSHPIDFAGVTLTASTNAIRGASLNPTRASGWLSFSGTISTTPAQCYTDYRELHTTGVAEVLGAGFFPYMDATASCASMWPIQCVAFVSAGATILTAAAAPSVGVYAGWFKTTLDGPITFASGAQVGAFFASIQANVTSVVAGLSCVGYLEVASGAVKDLFYLKATANVYATNFFTLTALTPPVVTWEPSIDPKNDSPTKGLRCVVGSTVYNIPMYTL